MKKLLTPVFFILVITCNAQIADSSAQKTDSSIIEAQFPGGQKMWNKYIQSLMEKNIDTISEDNKSRGTAEVEFSVAPDGLITNVKILSLEGSVLAGILYNAILNGPRWVAATKDGTPVESIRKQKVTFRVVDDKEERKKKKKRNKETG